MQNDESLKSQHDSKDVVQPRFRQKCTCPAVSGTAGGVLITLSVLDSRVSSRINGGAHCGMNQP